MSSTLRRTLTRSGVATALTAGLVLSGGAAEAKSVTHDDGAADVISYGQDSDTPTPEPDQANGDITTVTLFYKARTVGVKASFADLQKEPDGFRFDVLRIVTNEHLKRNVSIIGYADNWKGTGGLEKPNGKRVKCKVAHKIDFAHNVVTISVPRSCLSKPRWVKLGYGAFSTPDVNADDSPTYIDDSLRDGAIGEDLTLSKKIRRG